MRWAVSSAGRALPSQGRGREFESPTVHKLLSLFTSGRLAQRESAVFTRQKSQVQILYRPLSKLSAAMPWECHEASYQRRLEGSPPGVLLLRAAEGISPQQNRYRGVYMMLSEVRHRSCMSSVAETARHGPRPAVSAGGRRSTQDPPPLRSTIPVRRSLPWSSL